MTQDMGASPTGDRAVVNGAGQAVSALRASVPSADLVQLAVDRVEYALAAADYDHGHVITSDNIKLDDLRVLLQALKRPVPPTAKWVDDHALAAWMSQLKALEEGAGRVGLSWITNADDTGVSFWMHLSPSQIEALIELRPECLAQAIEARRAETQGGSVHESAVGEADAPTPNPLNPGN